MTNVVSSASGRLVNYDAGAQHYGEWLRGYDWQIYGCGTFRTPVNEVQARAYLKRFFERLEKRIRSTVGYFASMERRYSGCGMSPIPIHWHFLAASETRDPGFVATAAQALWKDKFGDAKIGPYDESRDATFYVAKCVMLPHCSTEMRFPPFLAYHGSSDLLQAATRNPFVPEHLKDRASGSYLRCELFPAV
ncbi:MAG: hypothetical protein P4K86_12775 [Terracidiphilus sp.]|nr:hypothetical protein [Terracidiphilus sp.]MDR3775874.1 hypothetical protein [Terracidiphilus sp.]